MLLHLHLSTNKLATLNLVFRVTYKSAATRSWLSKLAAKSIAGASFEKEMLLMQLQSPKAYHYHLPPTRLQSFPSDAG